MREDDERGFVLLLVLAGLAFLSFVAATTLADSRHTARIAGARSSEIEAGLLAEAGLARAALSIDQAYSSDAWPENGTPVHFAFGGGNIAVSIADEAGKVDIAAAPERMVEAVFTHAGIPAARGGALVSALRNARSNAATTRRQFSPVSIEELAGMIGMTDEEADAVRPYVTVHTGLGGFDPVVASPELVALLPGAEPSALSAITQSARADAPGRPDSPSPAFTSVSPRRIFTVRAEACTASGHLASREAVIERRSPGHFARIEMREPIDARFFSVPCEKPRVATTTDR